MSGASYLQFMAANSFKYSALYTRPTGGRGHTWKKKFTNLRTELPFTTTLYSTSKLYWTVLVSLEISSVYLL